MSEVEHQDNADTKPQRVLACVLCQQRKVKCDRKTPCTNCVKANVQCVSATLNPRQRRRRFPERELLERLRFYEDLLRKNKIPFEPLHGDYPTPDEHDTNRKDHNRAEEATTQSDRPRRETSAESDYRPRSFWNAMLQRSGLEAEDETADDTHNHQSTSSYPHRDIQESVVKEVWDKMQHTCNDYMFFGTNKTEVPMANLHPDQVQIFRLWQIYLDNINPLMKVTHTPTLQTRIIDAASNLSDIDPVLEALMFSIYCVSMSTLDEDECSATFGSPKQNLLANYRLGCQMALQKCQVLRRGDRDSLTALFLFLISLQPDADPRSLSSMLGSAMRIAQRMGISNETANAKCNILEAEMRRRLWWSFILFDSRVCELADYKSGALTPMWDCKPPLNINDFDLRPDMKALPPVHTLPTEALFVVVRAELGDYVRHSPSFLDFTYPALKALAKLIHNAGPGDARHDLGALETRLEDAYLKFCYSENPLHLITIWTSRGQIAKYRLIEHYSKVGKLDRPQNDVERNTAISFALRMLECDTKILGSPLVKGYMWLTALYFPFPAYIHIIQDLRKRPLTEHAARAWEVMSDNFDVRFCRNEKDTMMRPDNPVSQVFSSMIFNAWEVREAAFKERGEILEPVRLLASLRERLNIPVPEDPNNSNEEHPAAGGVAMNLDDIPMPRYVGFGAPLASPFDMGGQVQLSGGIWPDFNGPGMMDNALDLGSIDWSSMFTRGG